MRFPRQNRCHAENKFSKELICSNNSFSFRLWRPPPQRKFEPERKLLRGGPGDIPIVHTIYDLYAQWNQILVKFPKVQRYTLGETCSRHLLLSIELVLVAASIATPMDKLKKLKEVSAKIDMLKLLVRLAKDCKCITNEQYLKVESRLNDAGKMLGGWMKHLESTKSA